MAEANLEDRLRALNEVAAGLYELEPEALLNLIAERLRELLSARLVTIALPKPDRSLVIEGAAGERAGDILGVILPSEASSKSRMVMERQRSERVDDVSQDPEVAHGVSERMDAHSGLYVPLLSRGEPVGVLMVHDRVGDDPRFSDDDLRLAEVFATRAVAAVEFSKRVARDSLRRVLEAQEQERRRLALELHDETGQALASILLGLKEVETASGDKAMRRAAQNLRELVVETLQDVRALAVELRPKALDDFGLEPALERLAETVSGRSGLEVELVADLDGRRLEPEIETALYRIVQEALTNVLKHAAARRVSILMTRHDDHLSLVVEDDGIGVQSEPRPDALGLVGMRERAALLGGRLRLETSTEGTALAVEVPLPPLLSELSS